MATYLFEYIPQWLAYSLVGLVQCGLLLVVVLLVAATCNWLERKVSARIQDRLGPTRTGGRFGWLQSPADGLKLLTKEDLIPAAADRTLFRLAPYVSFAISLAVYLAIPWAGGNPSGGFFSAHDWTCVRLDAAVFFIMAVSGLEVFGVILGGYASGSKWSLYGAMREAAQVISYEIPLGLCVVIPVLIAGTMDLVQVGNQQSGWFTNWYLLHDPFTFATFAIYFTCAVAHTNRAPFDLPEAESELVAGFLTEYSGFRWTIFFMAEYGAMFAISALAAILFLGGWNGPVPVAKLLGLTWEHGGDYGWVFGYAGDLLGFCNLFLKASVGVIVMMWLRWTLPRLRIDQVMTTCLKYCLPLASIMLAGAMLWSFAIPGRGFFGIMPGPTPQVESVNSRNDDSASKPTSTASSFPRSSVGTQFPDAPASEHR
jgi:NADH-quinone oxidoreductase subunit H